MSTLKFFGQSCFTLQAKEHLLIFDPYLKDNPAKVAMPEDIHPDYILVTHGHADHLGDTVLLTEQNENAAVITTAEMGRHMLAPKGVKKLETMHIGGKWQFPFGTVRVTQALHGAEAPGGLACGFVVTVEGKSVYFAGDTGIFGDMKLLGELVRIDYALLPIGDRYTMGPEDAALATKLLNCRNVIPMHYNGNPRTMQDPKVFEKLVHEACNARTIIMNPGDSINL